MQKLAKKISYLSLLSLAFQKILASNALLPVTKKVQEQSVFWEKVFLTYPSHTVLIHDSGGSLSIIDVIDFKQWAKNNNGDKEPSRSFKNKLVDAYTERYQLALKRFKSLGIKALSHGEIEKRVYSVFKRDSESLSRLYKGEIYLRSQAGLADEFIKAAYRAQNYLPFMESVFAKESVPQDITRLAFVESMFNLNARSKVGASGIWQFMPDTGKRFLTINALLDERNSPYKATFAAAKLLKENYLSLRSWPLAITAYNHGKAGVERAVDALGTNNIDHILEKYQAGNFGFASRNFYSEFIAAAKAYKHLLGNGLVQKIVPSYHIEAISLPGFSPYDILQKTGIDKKTLINFNNCLRDSAFTYHKHKKLPNNFKLYLPAELSKKIMNAFHKKHYANKR